MLRHAAVLIAGLSLGAGIVTGCGSSSSSTTASASTSASSSSATGGSGGGSVTFTGAVTGTWHKAGTASDSTCAAGEVVIHIKGPGATDEADLHVKSDGSVWLDAPQNGGDYTSTTGGSLHGSGGFDVNADLKEPRGATAHASGTLSC